MHHRLLAFSTIINTPWLLHFLKGSATNYHNAKDIQLFTKKIHLDTLGRATGNSQSLCSPLKKKNSMRTSGETEGKKWNQLQLPSYFTEEAARFAKFSELRRD